VSVDDIAAERTYWQKVAKRTLETRAAEQACLTVGLSSHPLQIRVEQRRRLGVRDEPLAGNGKRKTCGNAGAPSPRSYGER
jgi:hypothetical protein